MRCVCLLTALVAAGGCREVVMLDIPDETGMQSVVIGVDDGRLRMFAYDLEQLDARTIPAVEPFEGPVVVYALFYEKALEGVGLPTGELEPATDPAAGLALPDFDLAQRTVQDGETPPTWTEIDKRGEEFVFRRKTPPDDFTHCFEMTVERRSVPPTRYWGLVRMSAAELLAFGEQGQTLRITPDDVQTLTSTCPTGVHAAAPAPGGDVFLGDVDGGVWRGHPDRGYELIKTLAEPVQAMSSNENPTVEDVELFVMTMDNAGHRFFDGAWTMTDGEPGERDPRHGEILRTGPNRAAVIPMDGMAYVTYIEGVIDVHITRFSLLGSLVAATVDKAGNVVIVNRLGSLLQGLDTGVRLSRTYESAAGAIDMTRFGDGVLYIRAGPAIVYGELDKPQCPVLNLELPAAAWTILEMNEDLAIAMVTENGSISVPVRFGDVLHIRRIRD